VYGFDLQQLFKAYALWQGIRIGTGKGIQRIIILGDSMLVIQAIIKQSNVGNNLFIGTISHILSFLGEYDDYRAYHIMRDQNHLVDHWDKYGSGLGEGEIDVNGVKDYCFIP
jgi:hypothetical protein